MRESDETESARVPIGVYWFVLLVAVTGVSSAGAMFQQVDDVPPVLRASWRLQVTSLILFLPALIQFLKADEMLRQRMFVRNNLLIIFASGCFVGAHFASWVASLDLTTLTHSLLFVTAHPLVVVCGMLIFHRLHEPLLVPVAEYLQLPEQVEKKEEEETQDGNPEAEVHFSALKLKRVRDPSFMELAGAALGFAGAGITFLDVGATQGKHTVTVEGDGLAFLGAIFLVLYMVCGRVLREWMPLFLYAFPVTLIGAIILLPISAGIEQEGFVRLGAAGWYATSNYIQWFFALALIAGLCGHTGMNFALNRLSPLIICTAATTEPVIGSVIGWALFDSGAPSQWTYVGGSVLLLGLMLVVIGSTLSERVQEKQEERGSGDLQEGRGRALDEGSDESKYGGVASDPERLEKSMAMETEQSSGDDAVISLKI